LAKPAKGKYLRNLPHIQTRGKSFFITFSTYKRRTLPEAVRGLVIRHALHDHQRRVWVHGLVVMPDHIHMVITPMEDPRGNTYGLAEILGAIKGASAHSINKALRRRGHIWQDESFDHILRCTESARTKVEYICENPVRRRLVKKEEDYPWLWREWVEGQVQEAQPGAAVPHGSGYPCGRRRT
jgi:REP element-mobilizing transposase RayT